MKLHVLSNGNKRLTEASPLDPGWGIGIRADDPRVKDAHMWRGKYSPGEALSAVREALHNSEATWPPLVGSAAPPGMLESTKSRPLSSGAWGPRWALAKALLRPIVRAHPPTKAQRFWQYFLAMPQAVHSQNMAPASSGVP